MSNKQFKYNIEYEVFNKLLSKKEICNATLILEREIKFIPELEIIERIPTASITKIISTKLLP